MPPLLMKAMSTPASSWRMSATKLPMEHDRKRHTERSPTAVAERDPMMDLAARSASCTS
jgi:hypothetical protein